MREELQGGWQVREELPGGWQVREKLPVNVDTAGCCATGFEEAMFFLNRPTGPNNLNSQKLIFFQEPMTKFNGILPLL